MRVDGPELGSVPVRGMRAEVGPAACDVVAGLVRTVEAEQQERVLHLPGKIKHTVSAQVQGWTLRRGSVKLSLRARTISALSNMIFSRSSLKSVCWSSSNGVSGEVVKTTSSFSA